jgi:hypothetical protein
LTSNTAALKFNPPPPPTTKNGDVGDGYVESGGIAYVSLWLDKDGMDGYSR